MKNQSQFANQGEIGLISPQTMIRRLLALKCGVPDIAIALKISEEETKLLAADSSPSDIFNPKHQALFKLYLKQKIKSMLRRSPFLGSDRGSELLQIERETYQDVYDSLIASKDITFEKVTPDWEGAKATTPIRKHTVK